MKANLLLSVLVLSTAGASPDRVGGEKIVRRAPKVSPVVEQLLSWDRDVRRRGLCELVAYPEHEESESESVVSAVLTLLDHSNDNAWLIGRVLAEHAEQLTFRRLFLHFQRAPTEKRQGRILIALVNALAHSRAYPQQWASVIGPQTTTARRRLLHLLYSPDVEVRYVALGLLSRLNPRSIRPLVVHVLRSDAHRAMRWVALECLEDAKEDARALLAWMERMILAADFHEKFWAPGALADEVARVMARLSPASRRIFDRLLDHQDQHIRYLALHGLQHLGATAFPTLPVLLVRAATCPDKKLRNHYLDTLLHVAAKVLESITECVRDRALRSAHFLAVILRDLAQPKALRSPRLHRCISLRALQCNAACQRRLQPCNDRYPLPRFGAS
jgi:hypothetical protein